MLKQWKIVLSQSFIRNGHTLNINPFLSQLATSAPLHDLSFAFPLRHRPLELMVMGSSVLSFPEETSPLLATRLRTGNRICAFGDGTVKDGIGAHGWRRRISSAIRWTPGHHHITLN
jgi:hypothetical protein